MKKAIFLIILLFAITMLTFGQISSTTTGGKWSAPSTWLGGTVPTANTDVIINGTVVHSDKADACRNLTINKGAVLTTLSPRLNGYAIKVYGNLVNNGIIRNNNAGNWLQIFIYKNVTNNGKWINYGVSLAGNTGQTISGTQPFASYYISTQNANNIIAGSDVYFLGTSLLFYKKNKFIIQPGKTITFYYSDIHKRGDFMPPANTAQGVRFSGSGKVLIEGKYNASQAAFDGTTLSRK